MRPFLVKGLLNFFHLLSQTKKFRVAYEDGIIGERELVLSINDVTKIADLFFDYLAQHFGKPENQPRLFKLIILKISSGYALVDDTVNNKYPNNQYVFEITNTKVFYYIDPTNASHLLSYSVDYISPRQALKKDEIAREITRYWQLSFYKDFDGLLRLLNTILKHRQSVQQRIFHVIGTLMALTLDKINDETKGTLLKLRRILYDLLNEVYRNQQNVLEELDVLDTNLAEIIKEWEVFLVQISKDAREDELHIAVSNALIKLRRTLNRKDDEPIESFLTEKTLEQLFMPIIIVPSLSEFEKKCGQTLGSAIEIVGEEKIRISAYLQQLSEMYRLSDILLPQFMDFWQLINCLEAWITRYPDEEIQLKINKIELKDYAKKIVELCQPFKINFIGYCKSLRFRGGAISEYASKYESQMNKYLDYNDATLESSLTLQDEKFLQRKYQEFLLFRRSWKRFLSDIESVKENIKSNFSSEKTAKSLAEIKTELTNDRRFTSISEDQLKEISSCEIAHPDIQVLRAANSLPELWPIFIMENVKKQLHIEESGQLKEIEDYIKKQNKINVLIDRLEIFFCKVAKIICLETDKTPAAQEAPVTRVSESFSLPLTKK